jgi:hypothetical protein
MRRSPYYEAKRRGKETIELLQAFHARSIGGELVALGAELRRALERN